MLLEIFSVVSHLKGSDHDIVIYNTMITGLCLEGLLTEAKELVKNMEENGCSQDRVTYNVIVRGLIKGCQYDDAMVYHEEMERRGFSLDSTSFSILLYSYKQSGDNPSLLKIIHKYLPNGKKPNS